MRLNYHYTTFGFNVYNYNRYWRTYTDADIMCSNFDKRCQAIFTREQRTYILMKFITCVLITLSFISITHFCTYCGVYNEKFNNNNNRWLFSLLYFAFHNSVSVLTSAVSTCLIARSKVQRLSLHWPRGYGKHTNNTQITTKESSTKQHR